MDDRGVFGMDDTRQPSIKSDDPLRVGRFAKISEEVPTTAPLESSPDCQDSFSPAVGSTSSRGGPRDGPSSASAQSSPFLTTAGTEEEENERTQVLHNLLSMESISHYFQKLEAWLDDDSIALLQNAYKAQTAREYTYVVPQEWEISSTVVEKSSSAHDV